MGSCPKPNTTESENKTLTGKIFFIVFLFKW
jgi:hypothetical protein